MFFHERIHFCWNHLFSHPPNSMFAAIQSSHRLNHSLRQINMTLYIEQLRRRSQSQRRYGNRACNTLFSRTDFEIFFVSSGLVELHTRLQRLLKHMAPITYRRVNIKWLALISQVRFSYPHRLRYLIRPWSSDQNRFKFLWYALADITNPFLKGKPTVTELDVEMNRIYTLFLWENVLYKIALWFFRFTLCFLELSLKQNLSSFQGGKQGE